MNWNNDMNTISFDHGKCTFMPEHMPCRADHFCGQYRPYKDFFSDFKFIRERADQEDKERRKRIELEKKLKAANAKIRQLKKT